MLIYIARPLCSFKRVPTAARAQADGRGRPVCCVRDSRSAPDSWSGWREIAPAIRATLQAIPEPTESLPAEYYGDRLRRPCAAGYGTRGGTSRGKGSGSRYGSMVDCPEIVLVHVQIGLIAKPVRQRAAQLLEIMLEPCLLRRRLAERRSASCCTRMPLSSGCSVAMGAGSNYAGIICPGTGAIKAHPQRSSCVAAGTVSGCGDRTHRSVRARASCYLPAAATPRRPGTPRRGRGGSASRTRREFFLFRRLRG